MKMPQELFDKWLAALRSGDIPQGKQYLHRSNGSMCCLGVLCHVAGIPKRTEDSHFLYDGSYAALSDRLAKEWGFYDWLGAISDDADLDLASMNDDGRTFSEIADFIENNRDRVLK